MRGGGEGFVSVPAAFAAVKAQSITSGRHGKTPLIVIVVR